MTITRQYNLPNCTLILEGFGDGLSNATEVRPVLSILTQVECRLTGHGQVLRGGRDFFESLVAAVSRYAQELLSGVLPNSAHDEHSQLVRLERLDPNHHRLTVQLERGGGQTVDLSTVELFDLVEAIDQSIADTQTLPQWSLHLRPLGKKYAPREPISQQAGPIAAGVSGLAIAAALFSALPHPQIKQPENLTYQQMTAAPGPTASPGASPAATASPSPPTSSPTTPDLSTTPQVSDPEEVARLGRGLEKQLNTALNPSAPLTQTLTYRVSVGQDGKIVGYRPQDPASTDFANETPLPKLRYIPATDTPELQEPMADFRVIFTPDGQVAVAPWTPLPEATPTATPTLPSDRQTEGSVPSTPPSPSPSARANNGPGSEILQADALEALQGKLYDQVDQRWKEPPPFNEDLQFRVWVNQDGKVLSYEPNNQAAIDYAVNTPLPDLGGRFDPQAPAPSEPFASFKVVFKPDGKLQVNPWHGLPPEQPKSDTQSEAGGKP